MMRRVDELQPDMVFVGELLHSTCGAAVIWYFNEGLRLIKETYPHVKTIVRIFQQMRLSNHVSDIILNLKQ